MLILIGQCFEILAVDKQKALVGSQLPTFEFPDIDYAELIVKGAMWLIVFFAFFSISRMIYHIFKLAVAGPDDENREMAKDNIKKNFGFLLLASLFWVALSYFQQGIVFNFL